MVFRPLQIEGQNPTHSVSAHQWVAYSTIPNQTCLGGIQDERQSMKKKRCPYRKLSLAMLATLLFSATPLILDLGFIPTLTVLVIGVAAFSSIITLSVVGFAAIWKRTVIALVVAGLLYDPPEARAEAQQTDNALLYVVAVCATATILGIVYYKVVCAARAIPPRELPPEDEEKMQGCLLPDPTEPPEPCYCAAPPDDPPTESQEIEIELPDAPGGLMSHLSVPRPVSGKEAQQINRTYRLLNPTGPGLLERGGVTCIGEGSGIPLRLEQSLDGIHWLTIARLRANPSTKLTVLDTFPARGMSLYKAVVEEYP